ncbi:MAG: ATP-binding protein, partial [Myxococcota bacterium]
LRARQRGIVVVLVGALLLLFHIILYGGGASSAIRALPLVPLVATLLAGIRFGGFVTLFLFLAVELVFALESWGYRIPEIGDPAREYSLTFHVTAATIILVYAFSAIAHHARDRAEQRRRRADQRLRYTQRLASMGTLAAGLSHEINNPLSAAQANLEFVQDILSRDDTTSQTVIDSIDESLDSLARINAIILELRRLARDEVRLEPISLQPILDGLTVETRKALPDASLTFELDDAPSVLGARNALEQVLRNLVLNAAQAQRATLASEPTIHVHWRQREDMIEVFVDDRGPGIAPGHLESIFDPFFTTKSDWGGLGLGLALAANLVEACGGDLRVENRVPKGARFTLSLPAADSSLTPQPT